MLEKYKLAFFSSLFLVFMLFSCVFAGEEDMWEDIRPNEHICPILLRTMRDPVLAADGHSYDREGIEEHFRVNGVNARSPKTNVAFSNRTLVRNLSLKILIQDWRPAVVTSTAFHPARSDVYRQTDMDHSPVARSADPTQNWPIIGSLDSRDPRVLAENMRSAKRSLEENMAFVTLGFKLNKKKELTDHAYLVIERLNGSTVELTGVHVAGDDGCCGRVVDVKVRKEGDANGRRQLVLDKFFGEGAAQPAYEKFRSFVVTQSKIDSVLSKIGHDSVGNFYYGSLAWGKNENCCTYVYNLLSSCGVGFENEKKFKKAYSCRDGENLRKFIEDLERDRKITCHIPCRSNMIGEALAVL